MIDAIPETLEHLASALDTAARKGDSEFKQESLGVEHGKHRAQLTPYSLEAVIVEYELLRHVLYEILDEGSPLDPSVRDMIADAVIVAIRNAASEFAGSRERKTQTKLRETDTRFRHMVDAVKDYAIFTVDPSGHITSWNVGAVRMTGYTPEEAIGQHFSMLYPEEGRRRDEPMTHLRTAAIEGRFRGEGARVRKGGLEFLADVSITPIYEGGKVTGFTKVVQDLTERNLLIQERDLSRSDAERLRAEVAYRERFVTALTHDLRSPLATAQTGATLISQHPDDVARVRAWTTRIDDALHRVDRMIGDLLDTSRLHAGEATDLGFAHCDVREIVEPLLEELETSHGDRFRLEVDGDTSGFWSPDGLRRVLDNLLSNAIKYGDEHKPITVRLKRVADHQLIAVHNFGTLIPLEEQQNLFRAYHRAPTAKHSGQPGWGIGLTLVKGIVEAHAGIVKAESYPVEGTTFTVDLPIDGRAASRQTALAGSDI